MPKLVYVYGDDQKMLEVLVSSLRNNGYSIEYTDISEENVAGNITADISLVCKPVSTTEKITMGGLTVDLDNMSVLNEKNEFIHFTPTEFSMLTYLMKNAARAVPRSELLPAVWGIDHNPATRVADDTLKRIRRKLQGSRLVIDTVWGYGFKIREI